MNGVGRHAEGAVVIEVDATLELMLAEQGIDVATVQDSEQLGSVRRQILDALITQELLWQEAEAKQLVASGAEVAARVAGARRRQQARLGQTGVACTAQLSTDALRRVARPPAEVEGILQHAVDRLGLTARGLDRLLRLARPLADLGGRPEIGPGDVTEALFFREAGAREVHFRIASPPVRFPCFYGIDMPSKEELIGSGHSVEEIMRELEVDSLGYLSQDGMEGAVAEAGPFCNACFSGDYPAPLVDVDKGLVDRSPRC